MFAVVGVALVTFIAVDFAVVCDGMLMLLLLLLLLLMLLILWLLRVLMLLLMLVLGAGDDASDIINDAMDDIDYLYY